MSGEERKALEEELENLKILLDFYVGFRDQILSIKDQEIDDHINDMLDRLTEIKKNLEL